MDKEHVITVTIRIPDASFKEICPDGETDAFDAYARESMQTLAAEIPGGTVDVDIKHP